MGEREKSSEPGAEVEAGLDLARFKKTVARLKEELGRSFALIKNPDEMTGEEIEPFKTLVALLKELKQIASNPQSDDFETKARKMAEDLRALAEENKSQVELQDRASTESREAFYAALNNSITSIVGDLEFYIENKEQEDLDEVVANIDSFLTVAD